MRNPFGGKKFEELVSELYPHGLNFNLMVEFRHRKLTEINPSMIANYQIRRSKQVQGSSVNREMAALRHVFRIATQRKLIPESPFTGIEFFKEKNRIRYLTREEKDKILGASPSWLRDLIIVGLYSGARISEILRLTWRDINLERKEVFISESKNGNSRWIPMNPEIEMILHSKGVGDPYARVFQSDKFRVAKEFKKICLKTGIQNCRFHDTRHTFGTLLASGGENAFTIKSLMGHKSITTSDKYCHVPDDIRRRAIRKLNYDNLEDNKKEAVEAPENGATDFGGSRRSSVVEQLIRNQ